ncbi:MAG: DUF4252 domain-containing protein [Bacteroidales bacterium]|jgi:hypothetical protein|nr:DUF4252 domain-containing protein [Bacteroidales bacterium]NMD02854.1 DUF4252 domain-containing protein [Bacteroidales bacterium]OQB65582.1 MAG: hypothetical protein BWX96_00164 [Bacteroidetes bacterium ADurb.Bin145]HOU01122.1 DUF4252 domain-containing protein [Bacteroidales bacterium]HQK68342.1 DUF4252 domain-containing protein [Bacteroidales bacterium]
MKKSFIIIAAFLINGIINAQNNPVDALFDRYSEKDGFTSVYISGKMLSMFSGSRERSKNPDNIVFRLNSIRIISQDSASREKINFYEELKGKLDFSVYEELMVVQEGKNVTKFLVRQSRDRISELLVITGGKGGNSVIAIRGDFSLKELSEVSKSLGIEELEKLEVSDDM